MALHSNRAQPFFFAVALLPFASVAVGAVVYALARRTQSIPPLCTVITSEIGCRIFSVVFNIIGWFTIPIYLIIGRILTFRSPDGRRHFDDYVRAFVAVMSFFSIIGFSVTILAQNEEYAKMAFLFVSLFLIIYFVLTDLKMKELKMNVRNKDFLWDMALMMESGLTLFRVKYMSIDFPNIDKAFLSVIMDYVLLALLFIKFLSLYKRLPNFTIHIENKNK